MKSSVKRGQFKHYGALAQPKTTTVPNLAYPLSYFLAGGYAPRPPSAYVGALPPTPPFIKYV